MPKKPASKRSRRTPLRPDVVLAAALKLADKEGLDALSMRSLAKAVKVEAMSLYNHLPSKDHILDGLVELVVAEIGVPVPADDWRVTMRARAHAAHTVLMKHPWATMLFVSRANIGPNMLRYVDATISCLRAAGFSYALADDVWNALDAFVYGFTLQKLNFPFAPEEYAAKAKQFLPLIPAEAFPGLNSMSQEVIAGRHDGLHRLEVGLEVLLEGFEQLRRAQERP